MNFKIFYIALFVFSFGAASCQTTPHLPARTVELELFYFGAFAESAFFIAKNDAVAQNQAREIIKEIEDKPKMNPSELTKYSKWKGWINKIIQSSAHYIHEDINVFINDTLTHALEFEGVGL